MGSAGTLSPRLPLTNSGHSLDSALSLKNSGFISVVVLGGRSGKGRSPTVLVGL